MTFGAFRRELTGEQLKDTRADDLISIEDVIFLDHLPRRSRVVTRLDQLALLGVWLKPSEHRIRDLLRARRGSL